MLVIDNLTVEQVLTVPEVVDALERAHKALSTGDAINAPNYRVFTPRDGKDYGRKFPEGGNPTHHAFTSLTGAMGSLNVTSDRVDSEEGQPFHLIADGVPAFEALPPHQ